MRGKNEEKERNVRGVRGKRLVDQPSLVGRLCASSESRHNFMNTLIDYNLARN